MSTEVEPRSVASGRANRTPWAAALARGMLYGAILAGVFGAGFLVRGAFTDGGKVFAGGFSEEQLQQLQYPLLSQAQSLLNEYYLRELPEQKALEYGAIRGLVGTLNDRLTFFIEPPVAAAESNVLAGQYGGIGVQLQRDLEGRFVLYPFRDGPAARAGVQDGDILLQVNGQDVLLDMQQDAADQLLRGEVKDSNGVSIRVQRLHDNPGVAEELDFTIAFEVIEVPSVVWRTLADDPDFGYIQIMRFTSRTPAELDEAIADLRSKAIVGLVLDLRNNPGGLLQESLQVTSEFFAEQEITLIERTRDGQKEYTSTGSGRLADVPIVAIINQGTASAAEILAGALKDQDRATLVGQKTYGKGSVQLIFQLADGSSLHITTAEFFPPDGEPLDGQGIVPNVELIPDPAGKDIELATAVGQLRQMFARG